MRKKCMMICAMLSLMVAMTSVSQADPRHREIHEAMEALRNAKAHLERAPHDFHGHRADAIHAIDEAQHQLEICMQYD